MAPDLVSRVESFLSHHVQPGQRLLAAFSGGLDSRVLLQLLAQARSRYGFVLDAMYVHHGLSPNADQWAEFCQAECKVLDVPFHCQHVHVDRSAGMGIEASARRARYAALLAQPADFVMLAHHQDDQAETLLLQLLRGAGAKGLSAMAVQDHARRLLRPLLDCSRAEIEACATNIGLSWIEDESNQDIAYDRNFCRHQVLPMLEERFPAVKKTLARSASHLAEAAGLLDELAALDAASSIETHRLNLAELSQLSEARARNLLRWWLARYEIPMPGLLRLQEMRQQLLHAGERALLKVQVHEHIWLRRYQGWAYLSVEKPLPYLDKIDWQGEAQLLLPNNGSLSFSRAKGSGVALSRLAGKTLNIRYREGGERFKPDGKRPTRSIKQLSQEYGIAPWLRERLPLLYLDEQLLMVPGIGVACEWLAQADEEGMSVIWQPETLSTAC